MKMKQYAVVGLLGVVGLTGLGCSGPSARSSGAGEAGGGADDDGLGPAGAGGDRSSDDGPDTGGAQSMTGGGGESAMGAAGAAGMEADPSPWIVYLADEETPGRAELYATRLADLGQGKRVNLTPHEDFVVMPDPGQWSPDGEAYAYQSLEGNELYVVHFHDELIEGPFLAYAGDHGGVTWSPSSDALLLAGATGTVVSERRADGSYADRPILDSAQYSWGAWKDADTIVHQSIDRVTEAHTLWISRREGESWASTPLARDQPALSFELSPDGQYVSYWTESSPNSWQLYMATTAAGSQGKKLAGPGQPLLQWSPDGARFLLSDGGALSWGLSAQFTSSFPSDVANESFASATFTPDGSQLQFWQQLDAASARLGFYDLATASETLHDETVFGNARSLEWAPDGSSYLVTDQAAVDSEMHLVLGDPTNPGQARVLDTVPSGDRISFLHFSDSGEFLVYDKEHGDSWVTSYVDLRGGASAARPPVKVPGEGLTWTFRFEPGGSNATYTQRLENGAEPCFFLDLSRQVAKEPVQVSDQGRVDYCLLQPRAK